MQPDAAVKCVYNHTTMSCDKSDKVYLVRVHKHKVDEAAVLNWQS